MPRDAGGNYTLPGGNPVVTGTVITSTWANPTMADLANEITNSLSRNGQGGMLVPFEFFDGIENAPGLTFTLEPTAGVYRPGNGLVGIASQGVTIGLFKAATGNIEVEGAEPTIDADLTRKDYVDTQIADSLQAIFGALYPVGSHKVGGDPNGIIPGTWVQLDEGTFLMNTIASADPSGGDNDAAVIAHAHDIDHTHATGSTSNPGNHDHSLQITQTASSSGSGGASGANNGPAERTGGAGSHTHTVTVPAFAGSSSNDGESATDRNKPLYKGVEAWERTA